jgi:hypothetical protein
MVEEYLESSVKCSALEKHICHRPSLPTKITPKAARLLASRSSDVRYIEDVMMHLPGRRLSLLFVDVCGVVTKCHKFVDTFSLLQFATVGNI